MLLGFMKSLLRVGELVRPRRENVSYLSRSIVTESPGKSRAAMAVQAVFGRFWSGRMPGAPPEELAGLAWLCAFGSLEEGAVAALGAAAVAVEVGPCPEAGSGMGSGFSSIRTMYW
jgi:hypothetical protein